MDAGGRRLWDNMAFKISRADSGKARKRLDPTARRAQLLEHAIAAFADAGIERAAHADVAKRAKVSTPTVFKYFPTRDELVDAVLSEVEGAFTGLPGLLPEEDNLTSSEIARTLSATLTELCKKRPNLVKVALSWTVAFSAVRERYKAFETRKIDDLHIIMRRSTATKSDAYILFASMLLFARMHFDETDVEARQNYIDRLCEIFEAASKRQAAA